MTTHGTIVLLLIGVMLILWTLNLVRRDRLYAGYGVALCIAIVGTLLILAVPSLLFGITKLVGAIFPASALTLLALCFIVITLIYVLAQITVVSNRLATAVQQTALQRAKDASKKSAENAREHRQNEERSNDVSR
jgi:Uncharacterized conserved protein (DUF2304)